MKQLEITGCHAVRLPYSHRTVLVPDGYKLVREPYGVQMALVLDTEKSEPKESDLSAEIDKTISAVCKIIQQESAVMDSYSDTVLALAALVKARFESN